MEVVQLAEISFPFDSEIVNGEPDRAYVSEIFRNYFNSFIGNGIFPNPSTQLQVFARSPEVMQVIVKSGKAYTEGAFYYNDDDLILSIADSDPVLNRIDAVVVQCDYTQRQVTCKIITGTPATNPTHYTPVRNEDYFELLLAEIYVPFASINVKQSNITDYRLNSTVCGMAAGLIQQVDTTTLYNQYAAKYQEVLNTIAANEAAYNAWYSNFKSTSEADFAAFKLEFNTWFNNVKNIIFDAQYFDFDNNVYRNAMRYNYTKVVAENGLKTYTEYLKNTVDNSVYATRTNTQTTTGWIITTVCEQLDVNSTQTWTKLEDGTWQNEMQAVQIPVTPPETEGEV